MATASRRQERPDFEPVERWFRQLDQRRVCRGSREWLVQVTGILHEEDVLWIQIAEDAGLAGSVLLRVHATTSLDQAVGALVAREPAHGPGAYPKIIDAGASAWA